MQKTQTTIRPTSDVVLSWSLLPLPHDGLTQHQIESEGIKALAASLLGECVVITHNADDKPSISGYNVSISHTRGLCAIMLSKSHKVGIDVEYFSTRVSKVADRFLRSDEHASTTELQLLHWCAKEAVFKLFSERHLTYHQMRITAVRDNEIDVWTVGGDTATCHYSVFQNFCIVYAWA